MRPILLLTIFFVFGPSGLETFAQSETGKAFLKLKFEHVAGKSPLVLRESVYTTPSGDSFTLTKLKYYTSSFLLDGKAVAYGDDNYRLVDLSKEVEFVLPVSSGNYSSVGFTLGVDSARNCSGAQTGALDPMNDMFWTWNTGYVMFKLEGRSPVSNADRNRIEHHVGGYRFGQNVATHLHFPTNGTLNLKPGDTTELTIKMDLDRYWQSENTVDLKNEPVCTLPGALAMKIAANFKQMFTLLPLAQNE